jgi:hypothetical protein
MRLGGLIRMGVGSCDSGTRPCLHLLPERGVDATLLVNCGLPAFRDRVSHVPGQSRLAAEFGNGQTCLPDALAQRRGASLVLLVPKLNHFLHRDGTTSWVPLIPAERVLVLQERLSYTYL